MTDIDNPEYIAERREEIVAALEAERISEQMVEEMDPDDVPKVIATALVKHRVPERHINR